MCFRFLVLSLIFLSGCRLTSPNVIKKQPANKVILITGASRGIGFETAKILAARGYTVYAAMRNPDSYSRPHEKNLRTIELDVSNKKSVKGAVKKIQSVEGRLDVLINNAGSAVFGPMEMISVKQARVMFETNFFGTMRTMQAVLPIMRAQKQGLIVNVSSTSGVRPSPGWDIYGASKFAIEGLSEAVAATVKSLGVDVVVVEPGTTSTNFFTQSTQMGSRRFDGDEGYKRYQQNTASWMNERLAQGQAPGDVAMVLARIVDSDSRHFRNQTSKKGSLTVGSRHKDPTGDASIAEQEILVKKLWDDKLDANVGSSYK